MCPCMLDGARRGSLPWSASFAEPEAIRVFVAAGVHVFPEPVPGRAVPGAWCIICFDAGWSVPIRRFCEHIATCCFPWMALLFMPIAFLATKLYHWMGRSSSARSRAGRQAAALHHTGLLHRGGGVLPDLVVLSNRLRYWSLKQDETGGAKPTYRMRFYSGLGIFLFALYADVRRDHVDEGAAAPVVLHDVRRLLFCRQRLDDAGHGLCDHDGLWIGRVSLTEVLHEHQYYFLGSLLFAFTVFYAYIHFSQYFIIWNGNMPEETFWYRGAREGDLVVGGHGHYLRPFLRPVPGAAAH